MAEPQAPATADRAMGGSSMEDHHERFEIVQFIRGGSYGCGSLAPDTPGTLRWYLCCLSLLPPQTMLATAPRAPPRPTEETRRCPNNTAAVHPRGRTREQARPQRFADATVRADAFLAREQVCVPGAGQDHGQHGTPPPVPPPVTPPVTAFECSG